MSSQRSVSVMAALLVWMCVGAGVAHAGVISKVGGGGIVTLTICRQATAGVCTDVTDSYLPIWRPSASAADTVYVVVNGSTAVPTLVAPAAPFLTNVTTSAYPGRCTNFGDAATGGATPPPDFKFDATDTSVARATFTSGGATGTGYPLLSEDCGGMAVLQIGTDKYVVPKDADAGTAAAGIPNALRVFGVSLTPAGDPDVDGLSTFDETVRGFIIGGEHKRLNPTVKNLFVHLVKGQCAPSLLTTAGFPVADAGALDLNVTTLIPRSVAVPGIDASQIHFLGNSLSSAKTDVWTTEWSDHFVSFTLANNGTTETWTYCSNAVSSTGACAAGTVAVTAGSDTPAAPATDRVVTTNKVYGAAHQKGLRVTECATTSGTSPHGTGRYGAGAAQGKDEAVVYTDRIRRFVNGKGTARADIWYSTFQNGAWTALVKKGGGTTTSTQAARNFITSKLIQYIIAMEIGHTLKLLSENLLGTVATFPHYAAGYGDNMDEAARVATTGDPTGVKYYIPSVFQGASQGGFALTGP